MIRPVSVFRAWRDWADGLDEAEFSRWLSGARRPQLDRLLAIPELRGPLVIALAEITGAVEVATVLTLRRMA